MKPAEWEAQQHLLFLNMPRKVTSTLSLHAALVSPTHLPFTALGGLCHEIFHFLSVILSLCSHQEISLTAPHTFKLSKQ